MTIANIAISNTSTQPPADPAGLSDLIQRHQEAEAHSCQLQEELGLLYERLPATTWSPEELRAHNVQHLRDRGFDAPRHIDLETIAVNDKWDNPCWRFVEEESGVTETLEGTRHIQTTRMVRETAASDEEIAAWKDRCAARRALYDAKEAAYDKARRDLGCPAAEARCEVPSDEGIALFKQIKDYRPQSLAEVLEKMKFFRDADGIDCDEFDLAIADLARLTAQSKVA